jgi:hypothetical protein
VLTNNQHLKHKLKKLAVIAIVRGGKNEKVFNVVFDIVAADSIRDMASKGSGLP